MDMTATGTGCGMKLISLFSYGYTSCLDEKNLRQLAGRLAEIALLSGQATTPKRSAEGADRRLNHVQYKLDGARERITQKTSQKNQCQKRVDGFARRVGRIRPGVARIWSQVTRMLQAELLTYTYSTFAALALPKTGHYSLLSHYVWEAVSRIIDALSVLLEVVESFQVPPAIDN